MRYAVSVPALVKIGLRSTTSTPTGTLMEGRAASSSDSGAWTSAHNTSYANCDIVIGGIAGAVEGSAKRTATGVRAAHVLLGRQTLGRLLGLQLVECVRPARP